MITRKPTRAELELKIAEQEKIIKDQFESKTKLQSLNLEKFNSLKNNHVQQLKINADVNFLQKDLIDKLTKEKVELFSANLDLSEKVNELQQEVINRNKTISKLRGTLQTVVMKMEDFYWSPITLKKDIKTIIND